MKDIINQKKVTINVIGLGYIGLPTSLMLSSKGFKVIGTDIDSQKVEKLKSGELTFHEEGFETLFKAAKTHNIKFESDYQKTNLYIVTVPTPFIVQSKKIDPRYVIEAVKKIVKICDNHSIIIIESTISPGFIDQHVRPIIREVILDKTIHLVHAPERILPGNMIQELINNSRTIGLDNDEIKEKVHMVYSSFCQGQIVYTDIKTAEMSKVVENTFRDVNIAFANELAKICREANLNVYDVIKISNMHPRVNVLNPGPGVGGHCIPVDPWFLVGDFPNQTKLISSARNVNEGMAKYVFNRIKEVMKLSSILNFQKVGLYGLSYKEDVDDFRESPTLKLLNNYKEEFQIYDPHVKNFKLNNQHSDFNEFLNSIDLIVIFVGHREIIDQQELLKNKVVLDLKNVIIHKNKYTL